MHLFFITRGIKHETDRFIETLANMPWELRRRNIKTNVYDFPWIQGNLKPILMWDYAFPKEHLQQVLSTIRPTRELKDSLGHLNKYSIIMRKMLGAQKIPEYPESPKRIIIGADNVSRYGIGIKEDKMNIFPHGYEYEMI